MDFFLVALLAFQFERKVQVRTLNGKFLNLFFKPSLYIDDGDMKMVGLSRVKQYHNSAMTASNNQSLEPIFCSTLPHPLLSPRTGNTCSHDNYHHLYSLSQTQLNLSSQVPPVLPIILQEQLHVLGPPTLHLIPRRSCKIHPVFKLGLLSTIRERFLSTNLYQRLTSLEDLGAATCKNFVDYKV